MSSHTDRVTKIRKRLIHLLWFALIVIVISLIAILLIDYSVEKTAKQLIQETAPQQPVDCIIVPGALVIDDRPSLMLKDRLDQALKLYQENWSDRILVSGDHGQKHYDEVSVMRQYLVDHGVPPEHVFMDHAGFDTYDTLYRARDVFKVQRAVVVTQDFHLRRALYIGYNLDLDLTGVASDLRTYQKIKYYRLREYPARVKAFFECRVFKSKPEFLGDPIPIWGSGLATQDSSQSGAER